MKRLNLDSDYLYWIYNLRLSSDLRSWNKLKNHSNVQVIAEYPFDDFDIPDTLTISRLLIVS